MKRKKTFLLAGLMLISFLLSGCGTPMYEITEEEEELIVQYSAYAVGKFNTYQKDGITYYNEVEKPDLVIPETPEIAEEEQNMLTPGEGQATHDSSFATTVTLAEAVGYPEQLGVTYQGYELMSNYKEGNYFSIDAKPGKQLLVAHFTIKNLSNSEIIVNAMEQNPNYSLSIDGKSWINQNITLLLYDLSTYYGTLGASESIDAVLLFEIAADADVNASNISLAVSKNGKTSQLAL